jgi:hypothetical protein
LLLISTIDVLSIILPFSIASAYVWPDRPHVLKENDDETNDNYASRATAYICNATGCTC